MARGKLSTDRILAMAWRYVWRIHGRGYSTSVGVHTRQLVADAWVAGFKAGRRVERGGG